MNNLYAGGQKEQDIQDTQSSDSSLTVIVSDILDDYEPDNLSEEDILAIHEAFQERELKGGPELDQAIRAAGFDSEELNSLRPPAPQGGVREAPDRSEGGMAGPPGQGSGIIYESLTTDYGPSDFHISSSAVKNGKLLEDFQCEEKIDGIEPSLPLSWENVPEGTESLAIVMYHYPQPDDRTMISSYLLLWGIDPSVSEIPYGEAISDDWYMGSNKDGDAISYTSPCSPSPGIHEYHITIFALSAYPKGLPEEDSIDVDISVFMDAIENSEIIGKDELVFTVTGTGKESEHDKIAASSGAVRPERKGPNDRQPEQTDNGKQDYSVAQAVSDNAQLHTIAFNALAFFTGDAASDTFFPPGKVSDFFGFQYFRDVDEGGMGHNTTFVPRVANNILSTLDEEQIQKLIDLALEQEELLQAYGYGRYPLMISFRKNLEQDYPEGKGPLQEDSVIAYSAELYGIDGELSYRRAEVLGEIICSLSDEQKARFDEMASGSSDSWGFPDDQVDKESMTSSAHVLLMTYASEMFTWYAGDVESDTYFCPERHGTYYGGFYMKDAPVMDDPDFFIDTDATGSSGESMMKILTKDQYDKIASLVDLQRDDLQELVEVRRSISEKLRGFMRGKAVDKEEIMSRMAEYGALDGKINYLYASTFAEVYQELTEDQLEALSDLRLSQEFEPAEGYLFAEPISYPDQVEYKFLFE